MKCDNCHEETSVLTDVRARNGFEGWCELCVYDHSEPCKVCELRTERFTSFEIRRGDEETIYICPECVLFWALKVRAERVTEPFLTWADKMNKAFASDPMFHAFTSDAIRDQPTPRIQL